MADRYDYIPTMGDTLGIDEALQKIAAYVKAIDDDLQDWKRVSAENFVFSGYGGIASTTDPALPDIGAGWQTLPADSVAVTSPRFVTQDPVTDSLALQLEGIWTINIGLVLSHNESNAGREFYLRLFNLDKNTGTDPLYIAVGRNQPGTAWSGVLLADTDPNNIGDRFVIQVGGTTDTISSVVLEGYQFSAVHSGPVPQQYVEGLADDF